MESVIVTAPPPFNAIAPPSAAPPACPVPPSAPWAVLPLSVVWSSRLAVPDRMYRPPPIPGVAPLPEARLFETVELLIVKEPRTPVWSIAPPTLA